MPHVFCLNERCRKVNHLHSDKYWDFKGKIKCQFCGTEMEVEIVDGEVRSCQKCATS